MAPPVQYNSRANTVLRNYWASTTSILLGMATTAAGFANPAFGNLFHNPAFNTIVPALLGTIVGNGANTLFNRWAARATSTVDQAYQEAIIWPEPQDTPGYLVLQPRHHKTLRHHLSDTIHFRKTPRILGWASTLDQAQALCHHMTGDEGQRIDPHHVTPEWQKVLDMRYKKYRKHTPAYWEDQTVRKMTGIWRLTTLPADTPESPAVGAYRTLYTAHGAQTEFYPPPPQSVPSSEDIFVGLKTQALFTANDHLLPQRLPPGSPLAQAPDLQTAWNVQGLQTQATIPWTLLNVAKPNQMPYWTAGCAMPTADGTGFTWHFFPEPPRTMTDPQRLSQDLRRYSMPDQTPAEWPVAVTPPTEALAQWNAQARPTPVLSPAAPTLAVSLRHPSL